MTAPHPRPDLEEEDEDNLPLWHRRREGLEGYRAQLAVPDGAGGHRWVTVVEGRSAPAYVSEMQARAPWVPMLVWWDEAARALRMRRNPGGRVNVRLLLPNGLCCRNPKPADMKPVDQRPVEPQATSPKPASLKPANQPTEAR